MFRAYNSLATVWDGLLTGWKTLLLNADQGLNRTRLGSPALRSQQTYFLAKLPGDGFDRRIFAVAGCPRPGVSISDQEIVFCVVNNDSQENNSRGQIWFGIQSSRWYNIVHLALPQPHHRDPGH